ncbi:ATP12 family chaperone protein [Allorhizobium terrae]|uniref:ATPase n=1 Tax=Allorhizobium terrae TaxID=1848972 RepID=A0A4S4A1B9_9HYPH|nr:ATP12 family protein [Allorhizobium terrae]THF52126.1 ATPase [Allorhizobium terrae]
MRDIFEGAQPFGEKSDAPEMSDADPIRRAQIQMKKPLPKRFYKTVTVGPVDGGFAVLLDGKTVKTPARNSLVLPTKAAAELVMAEWQAQAEVIDPGTMPITRLVNTALDAVALSMDEVLDDIVRFSGSDLLCYRADGPQELVARQSGQWDGILTWLADRHGARFIQTSGIMHVEQPKQATDAFRQAVGTYNHAFALASLHVMTSLTGSAVLALAIADGHLSLEEGWEIAHLDENWTDEHWGTDSEALARRNVRFVDMQSAYLVLKATMN